MSAFARSVAAHVKALMEPNAQPWDPAEAKVGGLLGGCALCTVAPPFPALSRLRPPLLSLLPSLLPSTLPNAGRPCCYHTTDCRRSGSTRSGCEQRQKPSGWRLLCRRPGRVRPTLPAAWPLRRRLCCFLDFFRPSDDDDDDADDE